MQLYNEELFPTITQMSIPGINPDVGCFTLSFHQGEHEEAVQPVAEIAVKINEKLIYAYNSFYGPIQMYVKADENSVKKKKFYYFDEIDEDKTSWTQLAVSEKGLPKLMMAGNFKRVVEILQEMGEGHE